MMKASLEVRPHMTKHVPCHKDTYFMLQEIYFIVQKSRFSSCAYSMFRFFYLMEGILYLSIYREKKVVQYYMKILDQLKATPI